MSAKQFILTGSRFACTVSRLLRVGLDVFSRKSNTERLAHDLGNVVKFNQSGSKYLRQITCPVPGKADVYAVLEAFDVRCPARQHAIKKLLCAGLRGKGGEVQDLEEARDAVERAVQMQEGRQTSRR